MKTGSLKNSFFSFLRSRHVSRHFQRFILLSPSAQPGLNRDVKPALTKQLRAASEASADELLSLFNSRVEGLSENEARAIRKQVGPNAVEWEKPLSALRHLWVSYANPFNILLSTLSIMSLFIGDREAAAIIVAMVLFSTLLRFWQERKAHHEADALKSMVSNTATVRRFKGIGEARPTPGEPQTVELPINSLVPGDIITLAAGDMIPADCRVLTAKDIFLNQATMTGESLPVEKSPVEPEAEAKNLLDLGNILFMGTNVVSGTASALVVATGHQSYFGALAGKVMAQDQETNSFQRGINQISWLLIRFMLIMAPLVLLINVLTKHDLLEALLFSCAIAVGLTPEMLPMVATATLAKGAVFLSRRKVIVKRLDSIQNFGAINVLCTDKTGTLTEGKIALSKHVDAWGNDSDEVLKKSWLNSFYQSGLKNMLDAAVLESAKTEEAINYIGGFKKVDEIPFDFQRRRMSVVVETPDGEDVLICKGAAEEILGVCTHIRQAGQSEALTPGLLQKAKYTVDRMNREGLRVVAVAAKHSESSRADYGLADEEDLTLVGYISFLDPPRESAAPALKSLASLGIALKVLTGDNEMVTRKICRDVGLNIDLPDILSGSAIETMSGQDLAAAVKKTQVFAKLAPAHKSRIVSAIKANGDIVGFMGDGINDAAAMRAADIGISVDSGADIAKEAADIILLEKKPVSS